MSNSLEQLLKDDENKARGEADEIIQTALATMREQQDLELRRLKLALDATVLTPDAKAEGFGNALAPRGQRRHGCGRRLGRGNAGRQSMTTSAHALTPVFDAKRQAELQRPPRCRDDESVAESRRAVKSEQQ